MPQLSLYIDDATFSMIEERADLENLSLSAWVKKELVQHSQESWPAGFENLFGSLKNSNLKRPRQISFSRDSKREKL